MAKTKTFAVEVEFTVRHTVYVEARRPGGAQEQVVGPELHGKEPTAEQRQEQHDAWSRSLRHDYDDVLPSYRPDDLRVTNVRSL